jgi:hypothetical protein
MMATVRPGVRVWLEMLGDSLALALATANHWPLLWLRCLHALLQQEVVAQLAPVAHWQAALHSYLRLELLLL